MFEGSHTIFIQIVQLCKIASQPFMASVTSLSPENFFPPSISLGLGINGSHRDLKNVNRMNAKIIQTPIKKQLEGKKFSCDSETMNVVNSFFAELDELFHKNGVLSLEYCWAKHT